MTNFRRNLSSSGPEMAELEDLKYRKSNYVCHSKTRCARFNFIEAAFSDDLSDTKSQLPHKNNLFYKIHTDKRKRNKIEANSEKSYLNYKKS